MLTRAHSSNYNNYVSNRLLDATRRDLQCRPYSTRVSGHVGKIDHEQTMGVLILAGQSYTVPATP